ncbi:MAG: hypothetical protein IJX35_00005 [Candidatus Methanomethylophilaceae archaeon]|nr:hypothetical protein [Candidatus Methanomethylophilaceae archaeon]
MTHVTRVFNPETRALTSVERRYAGQVGDAISTVLHFEYTQLDFLSEYVPYIMFAVYDADGNPLIYGPQPSNPSEVIQTALEDRVYFDGVEFSIPWAVTSRVKSMRVDYQIFFVKVGVEFDGRNVAKLKPTEIVMSAIDSIALKPSIKCNARRSQDVCACPPFSPTGAEPNLLGWVETWKNYGLVVPVTQDLKEPEFLDRFGVPYEPTEQDLIDNPPVIILNFRTYNGTYDTSAEFTNVPVMKDGKLIYYQLPYGNTRNTIPLIRDTVQDGQTLVFDEASKGFIAYDLTGIYRFRGTCTVDELNAWEAAGETTDGRKLENGDVYSCTDNRYYGEDESGRPELYRAGTNWVWSEQNRFEPITGDLDLSKYQLESSKINDWSELATDPSEVSEKYYPTAILVKNSLDAKLDDTQIIQDWGASPGREQIPSAHLVKASLDGKVDDEQIVQILTRTEADIPSTKLLGEKLDEKLDDTQIVQTLTRTETDIPSTKLLGEELDMKLDDGQVIGQWADFDPSKVGKDDVQIPSVQLMSDRLDLKVDDTQVVQTLTRTATDIPSTQLLGNELDKKVDDVQIVQTLTRTESEIPSTKLLGEQLDLKVDDSQVVQTLTRVADDIPSTKLLGEELDKKVDDEQIVQTFVVSETNIPSTKLLSDKLDEKVSQTQIAQQMSASTTLVPSLDLLQEQLDAKTDKTMAVPFWDPTAVYNSGATVIYAASNTLAGEGSIYGGTLFISLIDNNINNPPIYETESEVVYSEFWTMVKGSGGSTSEVKASALSFIIGNAKDTSYVLSHNLGTRELILTTRDRYTNEFVYPAYKAAGFSAVVVTFHDPPSMNQFVVTVSPASDLDSSEPVYKDFSNSTTWSFTHNKNHIPMVQTYNSNRQEILGEVSFDADAKTVIVKFNHAQTGTMVVR